MRLTVRRISPFEKEAAMSDKKKYIRFIDSNYNTLFHLPDGGHIRITYPDGEKRDRSCHFIDEYHTRIGYDHYHICEFAERMEKIGAKYVPLDYIREPDFYPKHFFAASETGRGPAYHIIDETETHGLAFAPRGAEKGMKYCVFERVQDGYRSRPGKAVQWSGNLRDIFLFDWGFDRAKVKAITQKPHKRTGPKR